MISSHVSDARQPSLSSFFPARKPGIGDERRLMADARGGGALGVVRLLGEDERADALRALRRIGNGRDDEDLANAAMRDESLHAIQHVAVAVTHRGAARPAGIAARLRLGEAETAHDFPVARNGTYFRFCSSVPKRTIGDVPNVVCAEIVRPCDASTFAISWITIM